ncbi:hypothetical protein [Nostoc sp. CCY0012]|uniref:hypothetical protein n=1 Tax=Nostoc sp. CCY0012 TaxID=1056123 RepID=UPI0039C61720
MPKTPKPKIAMREVGSGTVWLIGWGAWRLDMTAKEGAETRSTVSMAKPKISPLMLLILTGVSQACEVAV